MGRRKKEEPYFHRNCIAKAAEQLFLEKGILATTVDDIAKAAKYSKATIYVYFSNKEEIIGTLVLKSMNQLYERIRAAMEECIDTKERYKTICMQLVNYQEEFPLYFELMIEEINVDFDAPNALTIEEEIFKVGELLTEIIAEFLRKGISENVIRADIQIPQTVFLFWASLSGVIKMAEKKQFYIQKTMGITKHEFLEGSFEVLFHSICIAGGGTK